MHPRAGNHAAGRGAAQEGRAHHDGDEHDRERRAVVSRAEKVAAADPVQPVGAPRACLRPLRRAKLSRHRWRARARIIFRRCGWRSVKMAVEIIVERPRKIDEVAYTAANCLALIECAHAPIFTSAVTRACARASKMRLAAPRTPPTADRAILYAFPPTLPAGGRAQRPRLATRSRYSSPACSRRRRLRCALAHNTRWRARRATVGAP